MNFTQFCPNLKYLEKTTTKRNVCIVIENLIEDMTLKLFLVGKNKASHINYLLSLSKVSPTIDDIDKNFVYSLPVLTSFMDDS